MEQHLTFDPFYQAKRVLIHYFLGLSLISLGDKILTHTPIHIMTTMTETFIIISWIFFNVILFVKRYGDTDHEYAQKNETVKWTNISFYIIVFGALFVLLFSKLFLPVYEYTTTYTLITSITLGGLILIEFVLHKAGQHLNESFIKMDHRAYRNKVINNIGRLWLIAIGYGILMSSLSMTVKTSWEVLINIWIYLFVIFVALSTQYYFLSLYEQIDNEEHKDGTTHFISEKVMLFAMPVIFFWILNQVFILIKSMIYLRYFITNLPIIDHIISMMNDFHLDFAILTSLVFLLIFSHLKKLGFKKHQFYLWGMIVIAISFLLNVFDVIYTYHVSNALITENDIWIEILHYGSMTINILFMLLSIWVFIYIKHIKYPRSWMFVSIALLFPLIDLFNVFYLNITGSYLMNYLVWFRSNIVYLIQYSILGVLTCLLFAGSIHKTYRNRGDDLNDSSI